MALRSPTQTHNYWGFYATGSLPSSSPNIQIGDTAYDTSINQLVVCTAVSPVVWSSVGSMLFPVSFPLTASHSNGSPNIFAAIYLPACTLAAGSTALVDLPANGRQAELTLVDLSGVTVATWTSTVRGIAPLNPAQYQQVPITSGGVIAGGWYNIGIESLSGGSVNAHGLYLTT